ncbi:ABC transporter ATP-binding protein [Streptomyces cavernae]|uniref:ABC transporter ATP-binding protein n=1 Tax=Streptomyces cavernae TaxID=2259034 RepID=UPI001EE440CC|nr:ABC transporter ATP-binding protein [Streptomyces cavernae]
MTDPKTPSGTDPKTPYGTEARPTYGTEARPTSGTDPTTTSGTEARPTSGTDPTTTSGTEVTTDPVLLSVEDLTVEYATHDGPFRAVDRMSFRIERGGSLAVVGESGCGKSTLARALVRLLKPVSGRIVLDGTDIAALPERRLRPLRRRVQMVFQDPYGSLDPHLTAQQIVAEPLRLAGVVGRAERARRAAELIEQVGLPSAALTRRPSDFSGGQQQRIGIARALASRPELLVCDEATSALDVSVQAHVLNLLRELQAETGIAYLVIAHNLAVVREISTDVVVMRAGRTVETGPTAAVLASPADPYTRALRRAALDPTAIHGVKPRRVPEGSTT